MDLVIDEATDAARRPDAARRRVDRQADHRAHPRHARRADDLRREVRALRAAGRPRPGARAPGASGASPSASSRARWAPTPTSTPAVEAYVCGRLGLTPVPATQVIARDRHAEVLYACASLGHIDRIVRPRGAPPRAQRGRRGRGALRRGPEGLVGDAPQAQPGALRAPLRPGAGAARLPAGRPRGRGAVARARHLALERRARRPARRAAASRSTCCARRRPSPTGSCCTRERALENLTDRLRIGLVFSQSLLLALVESGCRATTPTAWSRRGRGVARDERRNLREVVEADADVSARAPTTLDAGLRPRLACSRTMVASSTP